MWYRKLFNLPKSSPKEGMYIESGKMPIRFIVMMRRLMYYWHVLHKDEDELLHRFMSAQQILTGRTDWITQVRKNMTDIELNLTDEQISKMSSDEYKRQIKSKI